MRHADRLTSTAPPRQASAAAVKSSAKARPAATQKKEARVKGLRAAAAEEAVGGSSKKAKPPASVKVKQEPHKGKSALEPAGKTPSRSVTKVEQEVDDEKHAPRRGKKGKAVHVKHESEPSSPEARGKPITSPVQFDEVSKAELAAALASGIPEHGMHWTAGLAVQPVATSKVMAALTPAVPPVVPDVECASPPLGSVPRLLLQRRD